MDFKSRSPRPNSIDGFVGRPRSLQKPGQFETPGSSAVQRRSTIGFDSDFKRPRNTHFSKDGNKSQPLQKQPLFSNYYSTYSTDTVENPNPKAATQKKVKKPRRFKRTLMRSGLVVLAAGVLLGGWLGWKVIGDIDNVLHGNIFSDARALVTNTTLKGETQGRVNILVAGDSSDRVDASSNGGELTDSLMVVSIDTKDNSAFMLSIPRDLWVNVPKEGYGKINSAYEYDGMSGLEKLVSQDLGIPIDYYALVNYQAYEGLVNAVGGINVNIQSSDPRGLYDPQPYPGARAFKLSNGEHTLNGVEALDLARARGDAYGSYGFPQGDFDRTQHQREMVIAIAQKGESLGVISNPIKVSQIFDTLGSNVRTDLNLSDVLRLIQLTKGISLPSIQSLSYSYGGTNPLLVNYTSASGAASIIPAAGLGNYSQLQAFYRQQTSNNPVSKEGATVTVLNGSDVIGLSHMEATALENEGFNVSTITDAANEYPGTMIIDLSNGKDPAAKQALEKEFSTDTTTTSSTATPAEATEAQPYSTNFVVVLGKNWDGTTVN